MTASVLKQEFLQVRCVRRSLLAAAVATLGLLGLGLSNGTRVFNGSQLPLGL